MDSSSFSASSLLSEYRTGNADAVGRLLERYAPWLRILARLELDTRLNAKLDASDIVQQTMLEAVRCLPSFEGATEPELQAWLRRILARRVSHAVRRYCGTEKRSLANEVSIDHSLAQSSEQLAALVAGTNTSPSQQAVHHERAALLAEVLDRLPDDYRQVITLRNLQGLAHEEVAQRMGRSAGAVRMLWLRALAKLREELPADL